MESENQPLDSFENHHDEPNPVYTTASAGKRFANYIIDMIMITLLSVVFFFFLGIFYAVFLPDSLPGLESSIETFAQFYIFLVLFGYYVFMESVFGRTVGKFITGTRVVDQWGNLPSTQTVMLRTIIRFVPFETFSFLGEDVRGWHDRWSDTHVIEM